MSPFGWFEKFRGVARTSAYPSASEIQPVTSVIGGAAGARDSFG